MMMCNVCKVQCCQRRPLLEQLGHFSDFKCGNVRKHATHARVLYDVSKRVHVGTWYVYLGLERVPCREFGVYVRAIIVLARMMLHGDMAVGMECRRGPLDPTAMQNFFVAQRVNVLLRT